MQVAIAGGNGYIGRNLTRLLRERGHHVVWLSHRPGKAESAGSYAPDLEVVFDPHDAEGPWADEVATANAVVNLSGHPISSRWNQHVKRLLRDSRIETGRALVRRFAELAPDKRPTVFVSASGIGIYGHRGDNMLSEDAPPGTDWLSELAVEWEAEALRAAELGIRTVTVRTGLVLGEEGLVPRMALPFRFFVGGPIGNGKQWVSWIHIDDIAAVYAHAIETETLSGPLNASGDPVTMHQFARAFGLAMHRPSWFPVPLAALRLVLGEVAPYTLMSQRADTARLRASGYRYAYRDVDAAMRALLGKD